MCTRNKILFVDDEPMVLNGLRRLMRSSRESWDSRFAEGGEQAIGMLEESPVDVVVSDMRMPGMNGAELLGVVARRWPETVRFVLSGYADRDLVAQCVGSSHQFLAKPCDQEYLKQLLSRAVGVRRNVFSEKILKAVAGLSRIPSLPTIYYALSRELQREEPSVEEVGRIVERDPALSAKLLQVVNSAFFGLSRTVESPSDAVRHLGIEACRSLSLMASFGPNENRLSTDAATAMTRIWERCLKTAMVAKALATSEGLDALSASTAYTAGLLLDCGQLVLLECMPEDYSGVCQATPVQGLELCSRELQLFGATHTDIAGYLLAIWGLPIELVEAVADHHESRPLAGDVPTPYEFAYISDCLLRLLEAKKAGWETSLLEDECAARLGDGERFERWVKAVEVWIKEN